MPYPKGIAIPFLTISGDGKGTAWTFRMAAAKPRGASRGSRTFRAADEQVPVPEFPLRDSDPAPSCRRGYSCSSLIEGSVASGGWREWGIAAEKAMIHLG